MTQGGSVQLATAMLFLLAVGAQAQVPGVPRGTLEAGVSAAGVDNGYGDWRALYVTAALPVGVSTVLFPEIATSQRFHDAGTLFGLGATQTLSDDWYLFGAATTSAGGFYLPRARGTVTLNRKLLSTRRLVLNVGTSYAQWKDAHSDVGIAAGAAYYFDAPFIVEGGTNRNVSRPGDVASQSYFVAVTEGRAGAHYLILRASGGREAYAALAPGQVITDFASRSISLSWRRWVRPTAGVVVGAERYANPFYGRTGLSLGAFWNIQ
jgi:YaiO family outer membrane protein